MAFASKSSVLSNIINTDRKSKGKQFQSFLSTDQCIDAMQFLLCENHYIIAVEIVAVINEFSSSEDYPNCFQYMCQCFKAAVLGLLENPKKRHIKE